MGGGFGLRKDGRIVPNLKGLKLKARKGALGQGLLQGIRNNFHSNSMEIGQNTPPLGGKKLHYGRMNCVISRERGGGKGTRGQVFREGLQAGAQEKISGKGW